MSMVGVVISLFSFIAIVFIGLSGFLTVMAIKESGFVAKATSIFIPCFTLVLLAGLWVGAKDCIHVAKLDAVYTAALKQDAIDHPCIVWSNPYATGGTLADVVCIKRKE